MPADSDRISRNKTALAQAGIGALICRLPENVVFLSGWWPLTGTSWAIFTADGDCRLIVPECEAKEAQVGGIKDISTYEWAHLKAPEPYPQIQDLIGDVCRKFGVDEGTIGIEESFGAIAPALNVAEVAAVTAQSKQMLARALPKANFADATDLINKLRVRKTPTEIGKLLIANEIAEFGLSAFKENVAEGITQIELAAKVDGAIAVRGSGYKGVKSARGFAQISSGNETARGWRPCEITTNRKLQKGDIVLLELGAVADGFWADNTRAAVIGRPNDKQKEIHELILTAQQAATDAIKPGVKMSDIDKAARDIIEQAGYGEYFIHITGHGIGWRYHEFPPLLHPDNDQHLEEGMVTTVEPGIYIPGFGGLRIEDDVAVTSRGHVSLTTFDRGLS